MKNLIIDCETLGVRDNAIVPMFAAMVTDDQLSIKDNFRNTIILHPLIKEQADMGSTSDEGTLTFWAKTSADVRDIVMDQTNSLPLDEAYGKFKEFLEAKGFYKDETAFIWQRGSKDLDWLQSLFAGHHDLGLNWWQVRDVRTAIDVLGASSKQNGYMDAGKVSDEGTMALMKLNQAGKAHHPAYDVVRDFIFLRSLKLV